MVGIQELSKVVIKIGQKRSMENKLRKVLEILAKRRTMEQ
jgi:hypothetical protein